MGEEMCDLLTYSEISILVQVQCSSETCSSHSNCWTKQAQQIKIKSWFAIKTSYIFWYCITSETRNVCIVSLVARSRLVEIQTVIVHCRHLIHTIALWQTAVVGATITPYSVKASDGQKLTKKLPTKSLTKFF